MVSFNTESKQQDLILEGLEVAINELPISRARKIAIIKPTLLDILMFRSFDKLDIDKKIDRLSRGLERIKKEQQAKCKDLSEVIGSDYSELNIPIEKKIQKVNILIVNEPDQAKKEKIRKAASKAMNEEIHAKYLENSQNYFTALDMLLADHPLNIKEIRNCAQMIEKNEQELSPLTFASDYDMKYRHQDIVNPSLAILHSKLSQIPPSKEGGSKNLWEEIYQIKERDTSTKVLYPMTTEAVQDSRLLGNNTLNANDGFVKRAGKWLKSVDKSWQDRIDSTLLGLRSDPTERSIKNRLKQLAGFCIQTATFTGKSFLDVPRKFSSIAVDIGRVGWNTARVLASYGKNREQAKQDRNAAIADLAKDTKDFGWAAIKTTSIITLTAGFVVTLPYIGAPAVSLIAVGGVGYAAMGLIALMNTKIVMGAQVIQTVTDAAGRALEYDQVNPGKFSAQEKDMLSRLHKIVVSKEYPIETRRAIQKQMNQYVKFVQEEKLGPYLTKLNEIRYAAHEKYAGYEEGVINYFSSQARKVVSGKKNKEIIFDPNNENQPFGVSPPDTPRYKSTRISKDINLPSQ